MRRARLNCPPISAAASNNATSWPASAAVVAQASPAGPAPTTATRLPPRCAGFSTIIVSWTRARIDETGRDLPREDLVEARLIARDAGVDLFRTALSGLDHEIGRRRAAPRHRHDVGIAARQQRLGTAGSLIRLVVTSGIVTSPFIRRVTQANAARGTIVAIVGIAPRASRSRVMIVAPAASTALASTTTSSHALPPSTRSSIEKPKHG